MDYGKQYYEFCIKNGFDMKSKGDWQKRYVEYIKHVFGSILIKDKCLDFGCAMGSMTSAFVDAGIDMVGVDVSEFYIKECPFANLKNRLFVYTDMLPFPDNTFDFIHASQVIEHISEEQLPKVLQELHRIMKPDGVLYFSTCGEEITVTENDDPTHMHGMGKTKWFKMFKDAHFENGTEGMVGFWKDHPMFKEYNWVQYILYRGKVAIAPVQELENITIVPEVSLPEEEVVPVVPEVPVAPIAPQITSRKKGKR